MRLIVLLVLALSASFAVLAQQRFDFKVREDMFAGMDGDTAAFDRAMKLIDDTLAADPDHAEALVWRGDGRLFLAGPGVSARRVRRRPGPDGARRQRIWIAPWPWRRTTSRSASRARPVFCRSRAAFVRSIARKRTA